MVTHPLGRLVDPRHRDDLHVGDDGRQRAAVNHLLRGCDAAGGRARAAAVLGGNQGIVQARAQRLTGAEPYQGTVATSIGSCTPPEGRPPKAHASPKMTTI
jgi:hypothetical protein